MSTVCFNRITCLLVFVLVIFSGCVELDLPEENVCFDKHITRLVARDCAFCHSNGEYGIKLVGGKSDYEEAIHLVKVNDSSSSLFLHCATGYSEHPVIWNNDSAEYRSVAAWIDEGARQSCSYDDLYGDCRYDSDCAVVSCLCDDDSTVETGTCFVNPQTNLGTCPTEANCHMEEFGACGEN